MEPALQGFRRLGTQAPAEGVPSLASARHHGEGDWAGVAPSKGRMTPIQLCTFRRGLVIKDRAPAYETKLPPQRKVEWSDRGFRWHVLRMTRPLVPLVEVTAPNGTKSLLAAFSVSHRDTLATVKKLIPSTYAAELSNRRVPPWLKFGGAHPGDVILIEQIATRGETAIRRWPRSG